jgi:hypothetical protein
LLPITIPIQPTRRFPSLFLSTVLSLKYFQPVLKPEPVSYWCGRFSSLLDRYLNDELSAHLSHTCSTSTSSSALRANPKSTTDQLHTPEANTRRQRRALGYLYSLCGTEEARRSFVVFQQSYAGASGIAELGRPLVVKLPERSGLSEEGGMRLDPGLSAANGGREMSKMGLMDRLLGKANRRSVQMVV